jgi:hypothetical protein
MAAAASTASNTNDTLAMIKKLEFVAAEAQLRADRLKMGLELDKSSYPKELTDALGELAKKAQVITTAELRRILVPFGGWSVRFGSIYNNKPDAMLFPFVKTMDAHGSSGFLVRCAPVEQYDLAHARIASIFQRHSNIPGYWVAKGCIDNTEDPKFIGAGEYQRFAMLASGKEVKGLDERMWKMI